MKQKSSALLLSMLLLSNVAHELHLKRDQHSHLRQSRQNCECSSSASTPSTSDPDSTEASTSPTSVGNTTVAQGEIYLIINATLELISAVNLKANVSVTLDFAAHLVATINFRSGAIVILNLTDESGIYIRGENRNHNLTVSSLRHISLPQILRSHGAHGDSFRHGQVSADVVQEIAFVLVRVSPELSVELGLSSSGALGGLLRASSSLSAPFREASRGYWVVSSRTVPTRYDILRFEAVFRALDLVLNTIVDGAAQTLQEYNITIDLDVILSSQSAAQFLYNCVLLVNDTQVINNYVSLFGLDVATAIASFSSNLIDVVVSVVVVLEQSLVVSVKEVVFVLLTYLGSVGKGGDLRREWNRTLSDLLAVPDFLAESRIGALAGNLTGNSLVISDVNVSEIVEILLRRNATTSNVDLLVQVVLVLSAKVSVEVILPTLVLVVVAIMVRGDVYILKLFDPKVDVDVDLDAVFRALWLFYAVRANPGPSLSKIALIGSIISQLAASLRRYSNGELDLDVILGSTASIEILKALPSLIHPYLLGRPINSIDPLDRAQHKKERRSLGPGQGHDHYVPGRRHRHNRK